MPILGQDYEPYRGPIRRRTFAALPIAGVAIRRNLRWWTWALLVLGLIAGSAAAYFVVFLVYGVAVLFPGSRGGANPMLLAIVDRPAFYLDMLMYNQVFWALALGTVVGAGEIAEDVRSGALVFYLGRPVTRADYVLGKVVAVSTAVLAVTLVPALVLFTIHALFVGTWDWVGAHWRIVPAATGLAALECVFVSTLVLGVSALVKRRRWATVAVAGVYFSLFIAAAIFAPSRDWQGGREQWKLNQQIEEAKTKEEADALYDRYNDSYDPLGSLSKHAGLRFLSPTASFHAAGRDLFGIRLPGNFSHGRHWMFLLGSSALLLWVLWLRVRAVEVVT